MFTSKNVQEIVDRFNSIKDQWSKPEVFNMSNPNVCGTIHCVGGWFALATFDIKNEDEAYGYGYVDGANAMARILGFSDGAELEIFAAQNSHLWGNENGYYMFSEPAAYGIRGKGAECMQDVVDHWQEVANRLKFIGQ